MATLRVTISSNIVIITLAMTTVTTQRICYSGKLKFALLVLTAS